jgi:integrase
VRVRLKGINCKTKRFADGRLKTYYWAWRGKGAPLLPGKPGDPEFIAAYNAAIARKVAPPSGVLLSLLNRFQQSGEFLHKINERTRRDYVKNIKRIERTFADFPIKALDERGARAEFLDWRDEMAKTSLRQADYAYQTLRRILSWALERGLIDTNPCSEGGKLYNGSRVDKVWSDEEIERLLAVAAPQVRLLMKLAIETGQRQGDIRKLTWAAYDGKVIKIRQRKTGAYVPVPVSDELKAELDAAPHRSPLIAVNSDGRPWTESGLQSAWRMATLRSGVVDRTFHDLRGTAVVRLARAGCTEAEIYAITGHKPSDIQAILTAHYLPRDGEVAANAIAKLNAYRRARGDQNEDGRLPPALPPALRAVADNKGKTG